MSRYLNNLPQLKKVIMPEHSRNILVVDDDPSIVHILKFNLEKIGYTVFGAENGRQALELTGKHLFHLIITDVMMPEMDGDELLAKLKHNKNTCDIPVIYLTAKKNDKDKVRGLSSGADDYLPKPFSVEELLLRIKKLFSYKDRITGAEIKFAETKKLLDLSKEDLAVAYKQLEQLMVESLESLITALEARDPYTRGHSERVASFCRQITSLMQLPDQESIVVAARFHDIGKIGISDAILHNEKAKLTDEQRNIIMSHPVKGAEILERISLLVGIIPAVKHHHEKYDGTGYPDRLKGEDIPLAARIISIADAYDAMRSTRTYRNTLDDDFALNELRKFSGTQFDPDIVNIFLNIMT